MTCKDKGLEPCDEEFVESSDIVMADQVVKMYWSYGDDYTLLGDISDDVRRSSYYDDLHLHLETTDGNNGKKVEVTIEKNDGSWFDLPCKEVSESSVVFENVFEGEKMTRGDVATAYLRYFGWPISTVGTAKISIYCAGTDETKTARDEEIFCHEASREVSWGLAYVARSGRTVRKFYDILKEVADFGEKIEYLSIYSHSGAAHLFLDNGEPTTSGPRHYEVITKIPDRVRDQHPKASIEKFDDFIKEHKDVFLPNALIVFAGCNSGYIDGTDIYNNIAGYFTNKTGIASIGADDRTYTPEKEAIRKVDNHYKEDGKKHIGKYILFYKDGDESTQQESLGKILDRGLIETAIKKINKIIRNGKRLQER
jgi:hypothetical protein